MKRFAHKFKDIVNPSDFTDNISPDKDLPEKNKSHKINQEKDCEKNQKKEYYEKDHRNKNHDRDHEKNHRNKEYYDRDHRNREYYEKDHRNREYYDRDHRKKDHDRDHRNKEYYERDHERDHRKKEYYDRDHRKRDHDKEHGEKDHERNHFYIRFNGVNLFVSTKGRRSSSAILIVHGLGDNSKSWDCVQHELNYDNNYIISVDLRGFGKSSKPIPLDPKEYSLDIFVQDIDYILNQLQVTSIIYIGDNLGANIGVKYARYLTDTKSEKTHLTIQKLILISFHPNWHLDYFSLNQTLFEINSSKEEGKRIKLNLETEKFVLNFVYHFMVTDLRFQGRRENLYLDLITNYLVRNFLNTPIEIILAVIEALAEDLKESLLKISTPTLILSGSESRICSPKVVSYLGEHIPNSHVKESFRCGSCLHLTNNDELLTHILDFIYFPSPREIILCPHLKKILYPH